jgi:hypothetical protein
MPPQPVPTACCDVLPGAISEQLIRAKTAEELGEALGLSAAETGEMEFRSDLTCALAKIIQNGKYTHAEIAKKAGSSRTRVTAIANGNTQEESNEKCNHEPGFIAQRCLPASTLTD